jgi:dCMP deaminase
MNALLQAGRAATGCTLYLAGFERLTGRPSYDPPCLMCSKMLVNAGVSKVVVRTAEGLRELDPQELYRQHLDRVIAKVSGK